MELLIYFSSIQIFFLLSLAILVACVHAPLGQRKLGLQAFGGLSALAVWVGYVHQRPRPPGCEEACAVRQVDSGC